MVTNDRAEEEAAIPAHALMQPVTRPHAVTRCPGTGYGLWAVQGLCTQTQGSALDRKQGWGGGKERAAAVCGQIPGGSVHGLRLGGCRTK